MGLPDPEKWRELTRATDKGATRLDQESRAPATTVLGLNKGEGSQVRKDPPRAVHHVESWVQELPLPPELSFPCQ